MSIVLFFFFFLFQKLKYTISTSIDTKARIVSLELQNQYYICTYNWFFLKCFSMWLGLFIFPLRGMLLKWTNILNTVVRLDGFQNYSSVNKNAFFFFSPRDIAVSSLFRSEITQLYIYRRKIGEIFFFFFFCGTINLVKINKHPVIICNSSFLRWINYFFNRRIFVLFFSSFTSQ